MYIIIYIDYFKSGISRKIYFKYVGRNFIKFKVVYKYNLNGIINI